MKQLAGILFFLLSMSVSLYAQSNIEKLDNEEALQMAIKNNETVVVFFVAEWCDYCNDFLPKVEALTLLHKEVKFFKIDYDENIALFEKEEIEATPTTVLYKKGLKEDKMVIINLLPLKEKLGKF
jgi:thiol-disulfide isomerase/thioredoxin